MQVTQDQFGVHDEALAKTKSGIFTRGQRRRGRWIGYPSA